MECAQIKVAILGSYILGIIACACVCDRHDGDAQCFAHAVASLVPPTTMKMKMATLKFDMNVYKHSKCGLKG